jgi:hypothetical protein
MLFPKDDIYFSYLNLKLESKLAVTSEKQFPSNPYLTIESSSEYKNPLYSDEFLFSIGYGASIGILLTNLDEFPLNVLKFAEHHPINRTFLLERWIPNSEQNIECRKAIFCVFALNRYVNHYFEQTLLQFFQQYQPEQFVINYLIKFRWINHTTPIGKIIKESQFNLDPEMFKIPLFHYRQRYSCFSPKIKFYLWEYLQKHKILDSQWIKIKKFISSIDILEQKWEPEKFKLELNKIIE